MAAGSRNDMELVDVNRQPIIPKHRSKSVPLRGIGAARLEYISDPQKRSKHLSYHSGSILKHADMIHRATGAIIDMRILPETGNITVYTTGIHTLTLTHTHIHTLTLNPRPYYIHTLTLNPRPYA